MKKGTTTRQRNDEVAELHSTGTLLGHGLERDILLDIHSMHGFPASSMISQVSTLNVLASS